jgi:hypothetical protein
VVNLDMIAYTSDDDWGIDLWGKTDMIESLELTDLFDQVITQYSLGLAPERLDVPSGFPIQNSDQWYFLTHDYPAFLAIEDLNDITPHYHRVTDTLSTLDLDYYADFTRAAVATIAHLAGIDPITIYLPCVIVAP